MCNMCARDIIESVDSGVVEEIKEDGTIYNKTIESYKRKHNITTDPMNEDIQKEVEYQPDLLSVSTKFTKTAYDVLKKAMERIQDTKTFVIATRTSQPFHLALAVLVLLGWINRPGSDGNVRVWKAAYVTAVAIHLGSQIWMTLVSGIVLYFNLPRHEFGRVQTVLFPVYYTFNATMSFIAITGYLRTQSLTGFENTSWVQLLLLSAVFCIEAYVRLSLVTPLLRAKHLKTQMEQTAGNGQEVGKLILGELAHCPRYLRVLKTFRTYHSTIAMGTLITLGCSLYSVMIIVDSIC